MRGFQQHVFRTMSQDSASPAFQSTHFACPACKQDSDHSWLNVYADRVQNPAGVPLRIEGAGLEMLKQNPQFPPEVREQKVAYWNRVNSGDVFLDRWAPIQSELFVAGMELSYCHNCNEIAVWLGGECVHPKG